MNLTIPTQNRKFLIAIVLLAAVILWVYYAYILAPLVQGIWQLGHEVRTVQSQLRDIEQAIVQEPQFRQQYRQL